MAAPIELSTYPLQEPVASCDSAILCLARLSAQNGGVSPIEATRRDNDLGSETLPLSELVKLAAEFGLRAEGIELDWHRLKTAVLVHPLLIVRDDSEVVVVTGNGRSGAEEVSVWDPHHDGVVFFVSREDFERAWSGHALLITREGANTFNSESGHETTSDCAGSTSPSPLNGRRQQTPLDSKPIAGVSKLSRRGGATRRSTGLRLCLAAAAIVATAGTALFLLTYPVAEHVADQRPPPRATRAEDEGRLTNQMEGASAAGIATTVAAAPTPQSTVTPTSAGATAKPAYVSTPGASTRDTSQAPPAAEVVPSTAATSGAESLQPSATVTAPTVNAPPAPVLSAPELTALLAHGDALLRKGDVAAARLFYERGADAGDGQSAIRLGETFDQVFLDHAQLRGARGDMGKALMWYRRARDLGAPEAGVLLEGLEGKQE